VAVLLESQTDSPTIQGDETFQLADRDKMWILRKSMERQFTAIIEKRGKWYVATVKEMRGVNTQGRTLVEARRNLKEATKLVVDANRELVCHRLLIPHSS
jgi:predicted RNase H-like HicB family nuclease